MRAAVFERYGPPEVLRIEEVEKPVPGSHEVLIRIHATTVCAGDWRIRKGDPFFLRFAYGFPKPKKVRIPGMELAGTIESVGDAVTRFRAGDRVFGGTGFRFGAAAEYACMPESGSLAMQPANMTIEEAAGVFFGAMSALHFLRQAKVGAGQRVLIYGASGSVGTAAVQLAKHLGAHVTAVCSTANLPLMKSLGADQAVDYTREDFSIAGRVYDVVFDTVGRSGFRRTLRALKRGGIYVQCGYSGRLWSLPAGMIGGMWTSLTGTAKNVGGVARGGAAELSFLKGLIEAGELRTAIDRIYRLDEIAEAHRYAQAGHKKGNVIVIVAPASG
ncbi:MAG: NAD(P)-dependent alcohol dehydrogenase [Bryobacteraceae bacterium]|jgi:NADPH:quinone reductase-like Zn-dependent oxidoreductase